MHAFCHTPKKLPSVIGCSFWVTFRSWAYVWCLNCLLFLLWIAVYFFHWLCRLRCLVPLSTLWPNPKAREVLRTEISLLASVSLNENWCSIIEWVISWEWGNRTPQPEIYVPPRNNAAQGFTTTRGEAESWNRLEMHGLRQIWILACGS